MKCFIKLIRLEQYIKNLLIFLPIYFGFQITNLNSILIVLISFISFSLVASSVYILNDLMDINEDRKHPEKKKRTLANGDISKKNAIIVLIVFLLSGLILSINVNFKVAAIIFIYFIMNVFYSLRLKHIPIIDIVIIALGFVLRVLVGIYSTNLAMSMWIIVITFLLALFLALAKRRDDVLIYGKDGENIRKAIYGYNLKFIDGAMVIMASSVLVSYILYTISPEVVNRFDSEMVYISALFVVIGVLRYLQITFVEEKSGNPTNILIEDRFLQLTILGWLSVFAWILYF